MNKVLISIGSNFESEKNINLCRNLLDSFFDNITYSQICETIPYGNNYKYNFLNQLAILYVGKDLEDVQKTLKSIEKEIGRKPEDKKTGLVKIDVDLLIWNCEILKPKDLNRSYIKDLLSTLPHDCFEEQLIF